VAKTVDPAVWAAMLSAQDLRKVLRAGCLPATKPAIRRLRTGLADIADRDRAWAAITQQLSGRAMSKKLKRFARAVSKVSAMLADDPQRQLESILSIEYPRQVAVDHDLMRANHASWVKIAEHYAAVYAEGPRKPERRTEREDWLFRQLFKLATKIKGQPPRPGILMVRFVVACAKLLDINLNHLSEEALRKRLQRLIR
jgi:hypothetical protein